MPGPSDERDSVAFVDTNIWVYAHLKTPGDVRHDRALALLQGKRNFVISPQVVAEYYSVMLKNAQTDAWIQRNLRAMFACARLQPANADVLSTALDIRNRYAFSFWDCQIAAAALQSGCGLLLTEDMQHGQWLDKRLQGLPAHLVPPGHRMQHGQWLDKRLQVINPLREPAAEG